MNQIKFGIMNQKKVLIKNIQKLEKDRTKNECVAFLNLAIR
jgi:hypothetical protein